MEIQNFTILSCRKFYRQRGFSLIEIITVLVLSAMILTATMMIFNRVRHSAESISSRLNSQGLPDDILQKIAEDIDRLAAPGFDASVSIRNKNDNGFESAQLIIENRYYGSGENPPPRIYERVIWQSNFDPYLGQMILYRGHSGLNEEETFDTAGQSETQEAEAVDTKPEMLVPVCSGLSYFGVFALTGKETEEQEPTSLWQTQTMPNGILLGLSLAEMVQLEDGSFELPESSVVWRNVAIDRTRSIAYKFVAALEEPSEPNSTEKEDPNKTDSTTKSSSSKSSTED